MNLKKIKTKLNSEAELVFKKLGMNCESFSNNVYSTCPVHEGSDNPRAFSFSLDKGIWKCWTRDCQHEYQNDIFGLIQGALSAREGKNLEFKDVLQWIASEFNISAYNSYSSPIDSEDEDDFSTLIKQFNQLEKQVEDTEIENNYAANIPSEYFHSRGFNKSTLKYFGVGDCIENGIMKERAIIPIHNQNGSKLVGLIGRAIKHYRTPKFLLYPKGFNKNNYFYNYHRAIKKATEKSCIFIAEGQGDVWKLYESGVKNAISVFGKSISESQVNKFMNTSITSIVILMDSDQAGREAMVEMHRKLSRSYKLIFPKLLTKDIGEMSPAQIKNTVLNNLEGLY
jgi:5S rRNA maturation endonuclease (ribonuclease M5)